MVIRSFDDDNEYTIIFLNKNTEFGDKKKI